MLVVLGAVGNTLSGQSQLITLPAIMGDIEKFKTW